MDNQLYNELLNSRTPKPNSRRKPKISPLGLSLPITNSQYGYFSFETDLLKQAKVNLINLLMTIKGERRFQPEFGSNLYGLVFEGVTGNLVKDIKEEIIQVTSKWLPYVIINDIKVTAEADSPNKVNINLEISVEENEFDTENITLTI